MSGWLDDATGRHTATTTVVGGGQAPAFSTTQKKFGSSSAYFWRVGPEDGGVISLPNSADWVLSNTWSISFWIRPEWSSSNYFGLFSTLQTYGMRLFLTSSTFRVNGDFSMQSGVATTDDPAGTPINGAWNHIAISRDGSWWKLYINGRLKWRHSIDGAWASTHRVSTSPLRIGAMEDATTLDRPQPYKGWIDAFHIEDGVSNWPGTSTGDIHFDYNAITEPEPTQYSVLLMNFNETFYTVQGVLSDNARIIVMDESSRTVEYDAVEVAGAYSIDVDDNSAKTVIAIKEDDGNGIAYGRVIPQAI